MADRTSQPREVLRSHSERLKQAITAPLTLAGKLRAKGLIATETATTVINTETPPITKAVWMLEDIRATLETSRLPFIVLKVFCDVLEDTGEPALEHIAASMRFALEGKLTSSLLAM